MYILIPHRILVSGVMKRAIAADKGRKSASGKFPSAVRTEESFYD